MFVVLRIISFAVGGAMVFWVLFSAMRTVVVPRAEPVALTRSVFLAVRTVFTVMIKRADTYERRDRVMAFYAPTGLLLLPFVWLVLVMFAYTLMFWGTAIGSWRDAAIVSGSSLLTLGFAGSTHLPVLGIVFTEAAIGLALLALLISYLPAIYGSYSRREQVVGLLEVRAGSPPSALAMLIRFARIGWLDQLDKLFETWERWFVDLEESHTTHSSLAFFRSPHPERSWVTAAGAVLDAAALTDSTLDRHEPSPWSNICIRAGYLALRRIADQYSLPYDPDPQPGDPISITRAEYDDVCAQLEAEGVALKRDRDASWVSFAGWRVNYDAVLLALAGLTTAPYAPWSSDRSLPYRRPPLTRRGSRKRAR